ncbi:peptidase M61 [Flavobacterium sp.]|uniref:M61 family metallopeptidase n=1 Tax=Flavobacterium sp. TaxID=239 RepID=UPI00286AA32C|nr:peptidase M61 [Flavobacterium sp.]
MKKIFFALTLFTLILSCKTISISNTSKSVVNEVVQVNINLKEIKNDKVFVSINPPKINTDEVIYYLPKIVPGTYSEDDYGRFIDDLKAFDTKGNSLNVKKMDLNSWSISNAKTLDKITYLVNDTFDIESNKGIFGAGIFAPTGSNIDLENNILLNTHCFVGYFTNFMTIPYKINISHTAEIWGATSMDDMDSSVTNDLFLMPRYAELVENPIMYSKPNSTSFTVDGMEILIAVYSPTGKFTAESIAPEMKKMMTAQKQFLGSINTTKKYSVLINLYDDKKTPFDAIGALEHPTATTVVYPEDISKERLLDGLKDVVSHEFFHILTPLTIHSKEIHFFDYNAPKMSKHLWMYEGVTEYFSNLFQINQGLIDEAEFYSRINAKINRANSLNDNMPFTEMSANVLSNPYKEQYYNVYEKGALIGMCLDIIIRKNSEGKRGLLDLMQQLSQDYGVTKPFNDDELFSKITALTYPEVGNFLQTYVSGPTPIPYAEYLQKVGITKSTDTVVASVFGTRQSMNIISNKETKEISVIPGKELIDFYKNLDLRAGDIFTAINDKPYSTANLFELFVDSKKWKENDPISLKIKRDGKEQIINGTVKLPYTEKVNYKYTDSTKSLLKEVWLKG